MSVSRWAWCAAKRYILCVASARIATGRKERATASFRVREDRGKEKDGEIVSRLSPCFVSPVRESPPWFYSSSLSNSQRRHRTHKGITIIADRFQGSTLLGPTLGLVVLEISIFSPRHRPPTKSMIEKRRRIGGTFRGFFRRRELCGRR